MHESSYAKMAAFVDEYLGSHESAELEILDFGSQELDNQPGSSYQPLFARPSWRYRGLDLVAGRNVDIVLSDPFVWDAVADDSVDVVVSGQVLEHVDYFWMTAFEIGRVLRPGGLAALIAPSTGPEHRYPLDCWRFYRDGFTSLARYVGFETLDVYTDWDRGLWADSMLVMRKPVWSVEQRAEFRLRHAHQSAVRSPGTFVDPIEETTAPPASVLRSTVGGRLEPILDGQRAQDGLRPARLAAVPPLPTRLKDAAALVLGPDGRRLVRRLLRRPGPTN